MAQSTYDMLRSRREEILALAASKGLKDLRVFGSVARGEDTPESDIDLLVNVADASDPFAFIDFQEDLSRLFSRKIDLVFESGLYHMLRNRILGEAKPI
jgi:predicted nucleotidyltransferase